MYSSVLLLIILFAVMITLSKSLIIKSSHRTSSFLTKHINQLNYANKHNYNNNKISKLYASTSSSSSTTTSSTSLNSKRIQDFTKLLTEITQLIINTGPKIGIIRTTQLIQASLKLTKDFIDNPSKYTTSTNSNTPSIPKILRRLFEELGATYIKLGQL